MPSDGEITFADHAGRFYARRYGMAPMVGRLVGYLAVCDPRQQTISELADALLASRSAIAGAVNTLESLGLIRRYRAAGERMDRVCIDLSSSHAHWFRPLRVQGARRAGPGGPSPPGRRPSRTPGDLVGVGRVRGLLGGAAARAGAGMETAAPGDAQPATDSRSAGAQARRHQAVSDQRPTSGITAQEVGKAFGPHVVLDKVSLTVEPGRILALLGPNGAGKTTMVRILSTLIPADAGSMRIAGHDVVTDPDGVRAVIGVTGQFSAVDNLLTGTENLRLMADLRHLGREAGRRRVAELLEQFDLTDAADKSLSTYSGGMRRRLDLAMTLVGQPRVIFLDEPTTGLDPRSRLTMWQIVRELAAPGVTILLTTQYLDEADQLADRIAVLDQGRIVAEGTPDELKSRIPGGHIRLHFAGLELLHSAAELLEAAAPDEDQLVLQVPADGTVDTLRELLDELHRAHIEVERLSIHTPDLDDVFLAMTGSNRGAPPRQDATPLGGATR